MSIVKTGIFLNGPRTSFTTTEPGSDKPTSQSSQQWVSGNMFMLGTFIFLTPASFIHVYTLKITNTYFSVIPDVRVWYRSNWNLVAMGQASLRGTLDNAHIRCDDLFTAGHGRHRYSDRVYWMLWCVAGKQILPDDCEYYWVGLPGKVPNALLLV